jgi:hypothetical protein
MENTYACKIYQVNILDHWHFYPKYRCTRERERESSNVNSRQGYGGWLWDKYYYLLSEVGALGIQVGRRPGQDPLDTAVMSIETHRQEEIRDEN